MIKNISVQFSGAGWLFPFYFGVGKHLQQRVDFSSPNVKVGGVSAGSVIAVMLLMGVDFERVLKEILLNYSTLKNNPFLIKSCLKQILDKHVIEDVSRLNKRLTIGVCFWDFIRCLWKADTINTFENRSHCMDAIRASCHIPLVSGLLPYYVKGTGYYDGELNESTMFSGNEHHKVIEVGLRIKPGTINPGIHLPEIWKYYPLEPFALKALAQLGYLKSKEYFNDLDVGDFETLENIHSLLEFYKQNISFKGRLANTFLMLFYKPILVLLFWITLTKLTRTFLKNKRILKT